MHDYTPQDENFCLPGITSSPFDQIRRVDEDGEYWLARELQAVMGYSRWEDFSIVTHKALTSLAIIQGEPAAQHHFRRVPKTIQMPKGAQRRVLDCRLTRFAAYLTAMAGDHSKASVAEARIYFAVKAREAEVAQQAHQQPMSDIEIAHQFADLAQRHLAVVLEKQQLREELDVAQPKADSWDLLASLTSVTGVTHYATSLTISVGRAWFCTGLFVL
ncbi:hypothetical protein GCM10009850_047950 [Nonomuraea monospora]|uniref:DNA-damage-inducible protein D n=1 Tax=Nonomuraea monospora TaxID=568818 RepID=A0ABN3CIS1_9ACTN